MLAVPHVNGNYEWTTFTDYTPAPRAAGNFNIVESAMGLVLALDSGERLAFRPEGSMLIDRQPLWARAASGQEPRRVASIPPIVLPKDVQLAAETVTGEPWLRADKKAPARRPTSVQFFQNWTYASLYGEGGCENKGAWFATRREIRGYAPTNSCDPGAAGYGENLRATLLEAASCCSTATRTTAPGGKAFSPIPSWLHGPSFPGTRTQVLRQADWRTFRSSSSPGKRPSSVAGH